MMNVVNELGLYYSRSMKDNINDHPIASTPSPPQYPKSNIFCM